MDLHELAAFLKSRRDRIRPAEVGLPTGPRRRVPGLRRDEVARLAGASVDYYTELERGRGAQPSPQMLTALARTLRLTNDERNHIFHLAGHPAPPSYGPLGHVEPGLLGLLDRLTTTPAQVITDLHETLVQNRLALALLGPPPRGRGMGASFVHRWFTDPEARRIYPAEDAEKHSQAFVADLRAVSARRSGESDVTGLVARLRRHSREFDQLWEERQVALRRVDRKRIVHPSLGVIELDCHNLFSEDGRQRLLWFSAPPGSAGAEQLELLSVVGTQDFAV